MPSEVITALLSQGPTEALPAPVTSPTSLLISTLLPGTCRGSYCSPCGLWTHPNTDHPTGQARHAYWPLPLPAILAIVCAHKQLLLLPSNSPPLEVIFSVRRTRPRLPILLSYTVFLGFFLFDLASWSSTEWKLHMVGTRCFCSLADSQHQHQTPTHKNPLEWINEQMKFFLFLCSHQSVCRDLSLRLKRKIASYQNFKERHYSHKQR